MAAPSSRGDHVGGVNSALEETLGKFTAKMITLGAKTPGKLQRQFDLLFGIFVAVLNEPSELHEVIHIISEAQVFPGSYEVMYNMFVGNKVIVDMKMPRRNYPSSYGMDDATLQKLVATYAGKVATRWEDVEVSWDDTHLSSQLRNLFITGMLIDENIPKYQRQTSPRLGDFHITRPSENNEHEELPLTSPYEEDIGNIYASYTSDEDIKQLKHTTGYRNYISPGQDFDTVCPKKISDDMHKLRRWWLANVYITFIETICIPYILTYIEKQLVHCLGLSSGEYGDLSTMSRDAYMALLSSILEYNIRRHLVDDICADFKSHGCAYTHPITKQEIRYWIMLSLQNVRISGAEYTGNAMVITRARKLASSRIIHPSSICRTMELFDVTIPQTVLAEIYAQWRHGTGEEDNNLRELLLWETSMEAMGKAYGRITVDESARTTAESLVDYTDSVFDLCITRFILWFYGERAVPEIPGADETVKGHVRMIWRKLQGTGGARTWRAKGVRHTLHESIALYRNSVSRYNWYQSFYSKWANVSHSYGNNKPSYVAKLDDLELCAIQKTVELCGINIREKRTIRFEDFKIAKLMVPVYNWIPYKEWKSVKVTWDYHIKLGHVDSGTVIRKNRLQYRLYGRMPFVFISCYLLCDEDFLKDTDVRLYGFSIYMKCGITGEYRVASEFPDVTDTVEATQEGIVFVTF